jgi:hypothetical protein
VEVLAGRGDLGDDTDLDVLLAGGAQRAHRVAVGTEVPAGSRVGIECLGAQQLPPGMPGWMAQAALSGSWSAGTVTASVA